MSDYANASLDLDIMATDVVRVAMWDGSFRDFTVASVDNEDYPERGGIITGYANGAIIGSRQGVWAYGSQIVSVIRHGYIVATRNGLGGYTVHPEGVLRDGVDRFASQR